MKKYINKIITLFILICISTVFTGCWDYSEITDFKYVAGMAVDRDKKTEEYILTMEVLDASPDGKSITSSMVQSRGKTIHSALREAIKNTGNMMQLSHAKLFIVSKDIAEEGIIPVIDLINRDVEVRNDMWVLISKDKTAGEILTQDKNENKILSYDLASAAKSSNEIGEYKSIEVFRLIDYISTKGISAAVPMISTVKDGGKPTVEIFGTAVFKGDKMIGELDKGENLIFQILKEDNVKFVYPIVLGENQAVSLEIMKVSKKYNISKEKNIPSLDMYIDMDVALSELAETGINYIAKEDREKLKVGAEKVIEAQSNALIKKLQNEYKSDIIGFGSIFKKKAPKEWEKASGNWSETFQNIDINVFVNLNIKYSGLTNKNIEIGD